MIDISDLSAGYPGKPVLSHLDLHIPRGKVTVIVGPNGCGKSTLLKTLAGILPKESGVIRVDGRDSGACSPRELARLLAYLPQSRPVPDISVRRLVLHGRFPYLSYPRHYRPQDLAAADRAMERMVLCALADRPVSTLSGGQRQKVYIAMALAQDAPAILLDEPTTYLDVSHQLQLSGHARFLAQEGKTVALVLHDLAMALRLADHIAVMEGGRVTVQGDPETVFASGCLDRAFGVAVRRFQTPDGWQYYCNPL